MAKFRAQRQGPHAVGATNQSHGNSLLQPMNERFGFGGLTFVEFSSFYTVP